MDRENKSSEVIDFQTKKSPHVEKRKEAKVKKVRQAFKNALNETLKEKRKEKRLSKKNKTRRKKK